jgi:hypothetical protein
MSEYTEKDLPVTLHHGELLTLDDGTSVRFDSNGEAKDVMINDSFTPACTLFPGNEYSFQAGGNTYKLTCTFEDNMRVEKA